MLVQRAALGIAALGGAARPGMAQPGAARPAAAEASVSTVAGAVVQAESGEPLEGATVLLVSAAAGAITGDARATAFLAAARSTRTDATGGYRFDGVAAGRYVLRVHRIGYRPSTLDIELRGDATGTRVSVGLMVAPVRLHAVEIRAATGAPYARHARTAAEAADARLAALRDRQARYLSTDVREVTHADVADGVTLGETDLFRALQRLTGVSTQSDFTAELWTRGARWDQTRVTFDGLPLFNPLHVGGLLSAVNADAVGAAFLHPGVRPASLGEGGAAVLELRSRPAGGDGALRGVGELSLLSARAALDQRVAGGRGGWMLSARRSYLDWLMPHLAVDGGNARYPYHFAEVAARGDWRLGASHAVEASVLRSQDYLSADDATPSRPSYETGRARWGNTLAQVTVSGPAALGPLGRVVVRQRAGVSVYDGRQRPREFGDSVPGELRPIAAHIDDLSLAADVAPAGDARRWAAGYALTAQRVGMAGQLRGEYVVDADTAWTTRPAATRPQLALWAERRLQPAERLTIEAGARAEGGARVANAGPVRLAPRLTARYYVGADGWVSAGIGRSYQTVQAVPERVESRGKTPITLNHPIPLWLVADAHTPVLRTDLATAGAERWLGAGWQASVNLYVRQSVGVVFADSRPLPVADRSLFVVGGEHARGVELGVRKLTGRWTAGAGYAVARARTTMAGLAFPSAEDRPRVLNATTVWRIGSGVRLGAAYTDAAGAPYTALQGIRVADDSVTFRAGLPNGARLPELRRLDLLADWSGRVGPVRAGAFLQVHNATQRANAADYNGGWCEAGQTCDRYVLFDDGLPLLPVIGLRLAF